MDGVQNSDVATLSLLNGGYGGYGIGGGRDHANFAYDGSVINAKVESNREAALQSHDSISQQISDEADRSRDAAGTAANTANFNRLVDKVSDQTAFFTAEINGVTREQAANAREAAKCCCEAKILAVQNQAKTDAGMATILAKVEAQDLVRDAVANAQQNAKLDALLAAGSRGRGQPHHGTNRAGNSRVEFGDVESSSSSTSTSTGTGTGTSDSTGGTSGVVIGDSNYDLSDLVDVTVNVECGGEAPGNSGGQGPGNNPSTEPQPEETGIVVKDTPNNNPGKQGGFLNIFKK